MSGSSALRSIFFSFLLGSDILLSHAPEPRRDDRDNESGTLCPARARSDEQLSQQEHPEEGRAVMGPYQPPTPFFGLPTKADRFPPPKVPHEHDQHEHGQLRRVHGALILLLGFIRRREEVASVLHQWNQYSSMHIPCICTHWGRGHLRGGGREQGEQDPQAKKSKSRKGEI